MLNQKKIRNLHILILNTTVYAKCPTDNSKINIIICISLKLSLEMHDSPYASAIRFLM